MFAPRSGSAGDPGEGKDEQGMELGLVKSVLDQVAVGVIISDGDGNIVHWNPAALRLHGYQDVDQFRRRLVDCS